MAWIEKSYGAPRISKDSVAARQGDRARGQVREHRRADGARGRQQAERCRGDGTTTGTVIAQAIIKEGVEAVTAGNDPMDVEQGIDAAIEGDQRAS